MYAAQVAWEDYLKSGSVGSVFRDARHRYKAGPAKVIKKVFVTGLRPREHKTKVVDMLEIRGGLKELVFLVLTGRTAEKFKTVKQADMQRFSNRRQPGSGGNILVSVKASKQVVGARAVDVVGVFWGMCYSCR